MRLNNFITGIAIAGLTVITSTSIIPLVSAQTVSPQAQTAQNPGRDHRNPQSNWDRRPHPDNSRSCRYERRSGHLFYCCTERFWNGRFYQTRTSCRPVRR